MATHADKILDEHYLDSPSILESLEELSKRDDVKYTENFTARIEGDFCSSYASHHEWYQDILQALRQSYIE